MDSNSLQTKSASLHVRPDEGEKDLADPLVSVVMPVYNGERYLAGAIESILNQTLQDFEFIIVDDGSTDSTSEILTRYAARDPRIRLRLNRENQGIGAALNEGCRMAKGRYIARLDADDVSLPERLEKQVAYMEQHADIGVLSSWVGYLDSEGREWAPTPHHPVNAGWMMWTLSFYCCIRHSSVMMRRKVIEQLDFYDAQLSLGQDYDLWLRATQVTQVAGVREVLVECRKWEGSVSTLHAEKQIQILSQVRKAHYARWLNIEVSEAAIKCMDAMGRRRSHLGSLPELRAAKDLLAQLWPAFVANHSLTKAEVRAIRLDAGVKLWHLAGLIGRQDFREGLSIAVLAMKAQPTSVIVAGLRFARRSFLRMGASFQRD